MGPADRAVGILPQLQFTEPHLERVIDQESSDQRLSYADDQLDRLGGLNDTDDAGQYAKDTTFGAARHEPWRRRLWIQAAIARAVLGPEHRRLPLEAEDAAVRVGFAGQHARVVHEIAGWKVVGAVDDDVGGLEELQCVLRR